MSSKRDLSDVDDGEIPEPDSKRAKKQPQPSGSSKSRQHQHSGIDPTWGQKYVFSSYADATTIPVGEESDFEDDTDAMAYLMSVRNEASGIPHLLVAPKVQIGPQLPADFQNDEDGEEYDEEDEAEEGPADRSIYTNGVGDSRGWYEDGAYMAAPDPEEYDDADYEEGEASDQGEELSERAVHEAYFTSLLNQYLHLRSLLNSQPPPDASSRLPPSTTTEAPPFGRTSRTIATWSRLLRTTDPQPLQLALMSKDSILRVLRVLIGGKFLRRGHTLEERTSRWLWALLARLPERGQLNHEEIGWVRDLGRRAVLLGRSLAEMAALREELEEGGLGVNEGVDGSSSDENVVADAESREVEGANSPGSHINGTAASPDVDGADDNTKENQEESKPQEDPDQEEGEVEDDEDVAMDIASNSSAEEGEAADDSAADGLEDAKARLLAQLDASAAEEQRIAAEELARERARMNMRATLNMILTVAGEFYGQRDLLEFREPFVGM